MQAIAPQEPEQGARQGGCKLRVMAEQAHYQVRALPVQVFLVVRQACKLRRQQAQGMLVIEACATRVERIAELLPQITAVLQVLGIVHDLVCDADCEYNGALSFSDYD